jgi:hypothetical protein
VKLLLDRIGTGQGPADDGGEILAHLFIEAQILTSDQGMELVLHQEVKPEQQVPPELLVQLVQPELLEQLV